jgi:hypothetical protein
MKTVNETVRKMNTAVAPKVDGGSSLWESFSRALSLIVPFSRFMSRCPGRAEQLMTRTNNDPGATMASSTNGKTALCFLLDFQGVPNCGGGGGGGRNNVKEGVSTSTGSNDDLTTTKAGTGDSCQDEPQQQQQQQRHRHRHCPRFGSESVFGRFVTSSFVAAYLIGAAQMVVLNVAWLLYLVPEAVVVRAVVAALPTRDNSVAHLVMWTFAVVHLLVALRELSYPLWVFVGVAGAVDAIRTGAPVAMTLAKRMCRSSSGVAAAAASAGTAGLLRTRPDAASRAVVEPDAAVDAPLPSSSSSSLRVTK